MMPGDAIRHDAAHRTWKLRYGVLCTGGRVIDATWDGLEVRLGALFAANVALELSRVFPQVVP
jgi:hypothetical protein